MMTLDEQVAVLEQARRLIRHKDGLRLLNMAVGLGWVGHFYPNGEIWIHAPDVKAKWSVTRERLDVREIEDSLFKYADPTCKKAVKDISDYAAKVGTDTVELDLLPKLGDDGTYVLHHPESSTVEPRTLVSRQPMTASRSKNSAYLSETTDVLLYSDGTREYGCRKCDYIANTRLAPSRHHANVHSEGKAKQPETFVGQADGVASYRPRQSRIDALAAWLQEQYESGAAGPGDDWETMARLALNWQHEQSRQGTEFAAEAEELSDSDILGRIRRLLDTGQMAEQQRRVADLEQKLLVTREQVERAEARAQRAQDTLHSFIELAREMDASEG